MSITSHAFLVFFSFFLTYHFSAFSQTESPQANALIRDVLSGDVKLFSSHVIKGDTINFAVNDCRNELDYTPVEQFADLKGLSNAIHTIIREEVGSDYSVTWADVVDVKVLWKETPIAIVFILTNPNETRMKINIFCTDDFSIKDVTLYRDSCKYF
jgi:hypothetical protein